MKKYYEVRLGYDDVYYVEGDEQIQKVIKAKLKGAIVMLNDCLIDGKFISSIKPDYARIGGFNKGYKLKGEDWNYVSTKTVDEHKNLLASALGKDALRIE